jgi:hypothetical protein
MSNPNPPTDETQVAPNTSSPGSTSPSVIGLFTKEVGNFRQLPTFGTSGSKTITTSNRPVGGSRKRKLSRRRRNKKRSTRRNR